MTTTVRTPGPGSTFGATLKAILCGWYERQRMSGQLARIGEHEAARVMRESGVCPSEVDGWLNAPFAAEDLPGRMMTELGLEPVRSSDPMVSRDIERVCMACRNRRRCRRALARGQASAQYHAFCPNAATFDALGAMDASQRP